MLVTLLNLAPCNTYSIQVGAGPFLYREDENTEYQAEEEEDLASTITQLWTTEEGRFTARASTQPVSRMKERGMKFSDNTNSPALAQNINN